MPNASAAARITHASAAQLREVVTAAIAALDRAIERAADTARLDRRGSRSRPLP